MAGEGVRVVSALHTVSAASLSDLAHPLEQDVLAVRRLARGQARGRTSDRPHRRAALRRQRTPGDVTHHRVADGAADRRQQSLQGTRWHSPDRAARSLLGVSDGDRLRAQWRRGRARRRHRRRQARARHGRRRRSRSDSSRSPTPATTSRSTARASRPTPTSISFWLADLIDERGWGLKDDTLRRDGRTARARRRRSGSTSATATWPGASSARGCSPRGLARPRRSRDLNAEHRRRARACCR